MYSIDALEVLAREAHAAARAAHRLEVARYVHEQNPADEQAEERLRESVSRVEWTQARLWDVQHGSLLAAIECSLLAEVFATAPPTEGEAEEVLGIKRIPNVREASLLLECAAERQRGAEAVLWEAMSGQSKAAINVAALTLHRMLSEYKESLQILLGSRSRP